VRMPHDQRNPRHDLTFLAFAGYLSPQNASNLHEQTIVVGMRHEQAVIPASLAEYLPPDHLARFIWQVVEKLDLRELLAAYGSDPGGGQSEPHRSREPGS